MAIVIHSISIIIAFFVSFLIILGTKGTKSHRYIGRIYAISMLFGAFSSFWIIGKSGHLSPIHLLSIFTIYWIIMGIRAAKLKSYNWKYNHIKYMGSSYIGIWIAGIGVMVRHYIDPGNAKLGFIASGILALILIPILAKISNKYKLQEQKD